MRTFYTLLLLFGVTVAFGQLSQPRLIEHPTFINNLPAGMTGSARHFDRPLDAARSLSQCDSNDLLDYSSLAEVVTLLEGGSPSSLYGFNANIHPIYIQPMSTFVDAASSGGATYMGMAFDTLAFQDYNTGKLYGYPLSSSSITVNGMIYIYQYFADTVAADGLIANDSLVFTFYAIDNSSGFGIIDTVPAGQVVLAGDSLASLYTGPTSIGFRSIPANVSFSKGQGFFILVQYLNKDTSTHFSLATSFVDSCGPITIVYNGVTYPNQIFAGPSPLNQFIEYPAQPAPGGGVNFGLTFYGQNIGGTVYNYDNDYNYQAAGFIPNPPYICSFVTNQHICVLPIINVCTGFMTQIQANPPGGCPGSTVNLSALVTGSTPTTVVTPNTLSQGGQPIENLLHIGIGDTTGLTYTWSASAGTLSSTTSPSPSLTMPASGNVTVSLIVNDGVNDTAAPVVIINNPPINLSITNTPQPVLLNCGSSVTLQLSVTGATAGDVFRWTGSGVDTTGPGVTSLTVSQPGEYRVLASDSAGCTALDSVAVVYANGVSNVVTFTAPSTLCTGQAGSFSNTSASIGGWTASWLFGDGHTSDSLYTTTHSYVSSGNFATQLVMDSAGCSIVSPVINVTVHPIPGATVSANGPENFCEGGSVTLSAPTGATGYLWSTTDTSRSVVITVSGNYTVTVTSQYGCTAVSANTVVIANPLPSVSLAGLQSSVCNAGSDTLTGGTPAGGTYSGQWVSQGIFHANLANPGPYTITYTYTDNNNCPNTATATLTVQNCLGIDQIALDNIRIFPNPTGDVINIYNTGGETLQVDLTDVNGKMVMEGLPVNRNAQVINLSAYSAGVYLLRLHDKSGNIKVVKVVKE